MELPDNISETEPGSFRKACGVDEEDPLILFLGRIDPIKGLELLIRAFSKVGDQTKLVLDECCKVFMPTDPSADLAAFPAGG